MAQAGLETYLRDSRRYDELLDAAGEVRPHWRPLIDRLAGDPDALRRGADTTRRLIIENGVTYNVYADVQGRDRPWVLDPLPLLLSAAEWREIEAGIIQRARLFEALLGDLYGPQRLLAEGAVPAELPFGHPNFLWPCHGIPAIGNRLQIYAADISRTTDGRWWVLADRTQTPSGPGYALENRQIVSRVFPDLLGDLAVRSLGGFFSAMRETLLRHSPDGEAALAVVLTPGSFNETYFEHAYLARYLGYPLVEGADLTTRDQQVYLRTVGGLRPVGTIVRRVDSESCDPLELDADSVLGVPGLANAAVNGTVNLANQLGGGALEGPGLLPFLAPLCRKILDEELSLPNAATWWCGHRDACDYVLANLSTLVVKSAFRGRGASQARYGALLGEPERDALAAEIRARPWAYCGQERVLLGTTPAWVDNDIRPVPFTVRVYLAWSDGEYRAMPGGLTRFNTNGHDAIVSMQQGGVAKDTWVLSGGRPEERPPPLRSKAVPVVSGASSTPSRLADDLF